MAKNKQKIDKNALEQLISDNFCGLNSVVGCMYVEEAWCPKTCGYYTRAVTQAKYWTRS